MEKELIFSREPNDSDSPQDMLRLGWYESDLYPGKFFKRVSGVDAEGVIECSTFDKPPVLIPGQILRPFSEYSRGGVFPVKFGDANLLSSAQYLSWLQLQACLGLLKTPRTKFRAEDQHGKFYTMRVAGAFHSDEACAHYQTLLPEEFKNFKLRTGPDSTDFWWDIENHVLLTYDQRFAWSLNNLLVNTLKTVNSLC